MKLIYKEFLRHDVPRHSAALSYFLFIGISSMLIVIASILSFLVKYEDAKQYILDVISYFFSGEISLIVSSLLTNQPSFVGFGLVGFVLLFLSSTAALTYLQDSLNVMMDAKKTRTAFNLIKRRAISFLVLLLLALIFLVLIFASTMISALLGSQFLISMNYFVQIVMTVLFLSLLYKYLPDRKRSWKQVIKGSLVTGSLLMMGKLGFEIYLKLVDLTSIFGVASYSIVSLIFIYICMNIIFLGAIIIALDNSAKRV
jgi:membrane protein